MAVIGNSSTQQAFTPAVDYFSGNASTTAFTLSRPVASVAQVQVTIDNVAQNPSSAYTVSNNTITFTSAPLSGTNNIYVYYTSPITQVIAPSQGSVTTTSFASSTGTGAGVFQTSPTITTPTIDTITSAASTALTLKSAGTTAVTIDTSQNVGIGTSSPQAYSGYKVLTINGTSGGIVEMQAGGSVVGDFNADSTQMTMNTVGAKPIVFKPNNSEAMRIDSSGKVLIGRTSPANTEKFSVESSTDWTAVLSNTHNTNGDLQQYSIMGANCNNTTSYFLNCAISGTGTKFYIYGNGTYGTVSDQRLKKNIETTRDGYLEDLVKLRVVKYNWSTDTDGTPKELGWIAQELEQVFPNMVQEGIANEDGNKYKEAKTSVLPFMLLKAIQELKAINDTQAETINALTARIEALEGK